MKIINFSNCRLSNISYGGSEKKLGIIYKGSPYMLKFQKKSETGLRNNHLSEYIGSHIFNMLGISCQETLLGTYNGEMVVACKDFTGDDQFVPFNDIGETTIETSKDKYQYSYSDIVVLLKKNSKLENTKNTINSFFNTFIIDALLGNFDRHDKNWGFIKTIDGKYKLAPTFDNGSCLYSMMNNEESMGEIMNNQNEINRRIYEYPTSQILLDGKKSSYYSVISSLQFDEVNKALLRIYPLIDISKINVFIDEISCISSIHKKFYKTMINNRYEKIIKFSYDKLVGDGNETI